MIPFIGGSTGVGLGGLGTTIGIGVAVGIGASAPSVPMENEHEAGWPDTLPKDKECDDGDCPPCRTVSGRIVPVGTIGYRPLDIPNRPQHGIDGPHHNILQANQIPKGNPVGECDCFWKPIGAVRPEELPAGAIPIEPFAN